MSLILIKNKKGRIVSVSAARKKFLLDPKPVALKANGQPKEDANGNFYPILKSRDEEGWTDVTPEEVKAYEAALEEDMQDANEVKDAQRAAELATQTASALAAKANSADTKNANKKSTAGRKSNAQKEAEAAAAKEELEAAVRDAEGDKAKYDALSDDGKEMYLSLFGDSPEA